MYITKQVLDILELIGEIISKIFKDTLPHGRSFGSKQMEFIDIHNILPSTVNLPFEDLL